jgi:hypothetical protein
MLTDLVNDFKILPHSQTHESYCPLECHAMRLRTFRRNLLPPSSVCKWFRRNVTSTTRFTYRMWNLHIQAFPPEDDLFHGWKLSLAWRFRSLRAFRKKVPRRWRLLHPPKRHSVCAQHLRDCHGRKGLVCEWRLRSDSKHELLRAPSSSRQMSQAPPTSLPMHHSAVQTLQTTDVPRIAPSGRKQLERVADQAVASSAVDGVVAVSQRHSRPALLNTGRHFHGPPNRRPYSLLLSAVQGLHLGCCERPWTTTSFVATARCDGCLSSCPETGPSEWVPPEDRGRIRSPVDGGENCRTAFCL